MFTKKKLEKIGKDFNDIKTKNGTKFYKQMWKDEGNLPNPFDVVREFIIEKGLKLYGGQALHEHLSKFGKGLYTKDEFPDYDVFSPDAWNHAKELADKLYKLGFIYTEARSSILNNEHHQTYKVSVDMLYIFDITQMGCKRSDYLNKKCKNCGETKDKKCLSIFNNIPCNNIFNYKKKNNPTFYDTYDYKNNIGLYPNKLFVADPNWLKISMYRELTEPQSNPERFSKVGPRLDQFENVFKYNHKQCDLTEKQYDIEVTKHFKPILKHIALFIKKNKLINYGSTAYNFFLKGGKYKGNINVADYQVYSYKPVFLYTKLFNELEKKFPKYKFNKELIKSYWKSEDADDYVINVSYKKIKYNKIIKFTYHSTCMPYVQSKGIRYVTIDRLKYNLYRAVALNSVFKQVEERPENYKCILSYILKNQAKWTRKYRNNKHKFQRIISKCDGEEVSQKYVNLLDKWIEKEDLIKKTKYNIDKPKKGYITKIYPKPSETLILPYRPHENIIKTSKNRKQKSRKQKSRKQKSRKQKYKAIINDYNDKISPKNFDIE